jgi:glycosyltransferase involved in cell wall biosynthesis
VYQADWLDLRRLAGRVPLASLVHDVRPHSHPYPARVEDRLLRLLYSEKCAGHLIVFSETLKSELVESFRVAAERVSVIPHWLDASDLRLAELTRPTRPFVLFFGRLEPYKGLDVLLAAAMHLGADAEFDIVIAGDGPDSQKAAIRDAERHAPVLRAELGRVSGRRKAELLSTASLIVLPYSEFHSFSGVLADAYAYRLPSLVSDVSALASIVQEDGTGWVTPAGDSLALAQAMTLAVQEIEAGSTVVATIERVAAKHDHSQVGPLLRKALTTAIEQSGKRRQG